MSKKIFISHAVKDKVIADSFVDLILQGGLSVPIIEIFCVSTDGTKIPSGNDWRDSIKKNILSAHINFLLITPNYKESEVCLNEMGAAWMTEAVVLPLIIEPITYRTVGVIQEPTQIEKILDSGSLDRIKDIVQEKLSIDPALIKSDRWTTKKMEFIAKIKKHIADNPFNAPMDRSTFEKVFKENEDLQKTLTALVEEKEEQKLLIEDLKKAKDKEAVSKILKAKKTSTKFDEFMELCDPVKKNLQRNSGILNGIIYKSYTNTHITIGVEGNISELDKALADGYIDGETLSIRWDATKDMRKLNGLLNNVHNFMKSELDETFTEEYDNAFEAEFDMSVVGFWEEVFEAPVRFK